MKLLTIEICLVGTVKKIRRRLQITDDYNLNCLHIAIQEMFYLNYEQEHEFEFNNKVYLPACEYDFKQLLQMQEELTKEMKQLQMQGVDIEHLHNTNKSYHDDCTTTLADLQLNVGDSIDYTYDQENQYEFTIELMQTNPATKSKLKLTEVKGKFVPEGLDVDTYNQIKQAKDGEQHEQLKQLEAMFDANLIANNINQLLPTTTMYD